MMMTERIRIRASIHDRLDDDLRDALRAKAKAAVPPIGRSFLVPSPVLSADRLAPALAARLDRIEAAIARLEVAIAGRPPRDRPSPVRPERLQ
jgi:hypothetical protein